MSYEYRSQLIDQIIYAQTKLTFLRDATPVELKVLGDWDMIAYSFSKAFEILWDHAKADLSGLLLQPLLMLWRQSVELSIKAALFEVEGQIDASLGHNIAALFERLSSALARLGYPHDDEFTQSVRAMISEVHELDRSADRFRYPTAKNGKAFKPVHADLDKLFQAHFLITTYCNASGDEVSAARQIGYDVGGTN